MVWCPGIVEIVRRTTRELFHHEWLIGNFFGKYLVMTCETGVFARKYRRVPRENFDGRAIAQLSKFHPGPR
jgi:hypothetical protein